MKSIAIAIMVLFAVVEVLSLITYLRSADSQPRAIAVQTSKMARCGLVIGLATVGLKSIYIPHFIGNIALSCELMVFILCIMNPVAMKLRYKKIKKSAEEQHNKEIWDKVFK